MKNNNNKRDKSSVFKKKKKKKRSDILKSTYRSYSISMKLKTEQKLTYKTN